MPAVIRRASSPASHSGRPPHGSANRPAAGLSWAGTGDGDRTAGFGLLGQNLAAVAANYRRAGIGRFVLAYFARDPGEVRGVQEALGLPLRVVRLTDRPVGEVAHEVLAFLGWK
jgi:hypothetical protein